MNHFDGDGKAWMVDTSGKESTRRTARAGGRVCLKATTWDGILAGQVGKGDVLGVARLAGIMSTKLTPQLIPLCHPIPIDAVEIDFQHRSGVNDQRELWIMATVTATGRTGVEMEALTAVATAALTVYDMCKSIDREMEIRDIHLIEKTGGKSGDFVRSDCKYEEQ